MPTIFSHVIFASAIGTIFDYESMPIRFWVLTAICSVLPDADVVAFVFGVNYGNMFGHRGITHSIAFAVLVGVIVGISAFRRIKVSNWKLILYFALVTFSHPLLDMLTNGGRGVALFAPFNGKRYFFPWQPVEVSPIGLQFFSESGIAVLVSEVLWIWLPSMLIMLVAWTTRRKASWKEGNDLPG